jgi:tetratricopeptide (TPR) repeat protein
MASVGSRPAASSWLRAAARATLVALAAAGCDGQAGDAPRATTPLASPAVVPLSWRGPLFGPPTPSPQAMFPPVDEVALARGGRLGPVAEPAPVPLPPVDEPPMPPTDEPTAPSAEAVTPGIEDEAEELVLERLPPADEPPAMAMAECAPPPIDAEPTPELPVDPPRHAAADVAVAEQPQPEPAPTAAATPIETSPAPPAPVGSAPPAEATMTFDVDAASVLESDLDLLADAAPNMTGHPTGAIVNERAQTKIRRGYELAQRGANFAARREFIEVLQMIAEAKDQIYGAQRRALALANGLRALDEAADFLPRGSEIDAPINVAVIVSSHHTPVGRAASAEGMMPQKLADLYFRYAQVQLGAAVSGEPAGSMALHALGKLYSQLGRVEPEKHPQADRRAFALQQAALLARHDNHLAAHELGVLLAQAGHLAEAEQMLSQVVVREPHPIVFRNLARVQRRLGREQLALASERQAEVFAARAAANEGVVWVAPEALAQTGDALAPPMPASRAAAARPQPLAPGAGPVQNAVRPAPNFRR